MADVIYNSFKQKIMDGSIDLDTDTIKVALVTSLYTPDQDSHEDFADVSNEVTGTGYTAGGVELTGKTVTKDNTNNRGIFDAGNASWENVSITARGAIVYKSTGDSSTSWLICYLDFTEDKTADAVNFTIQFNSNGILTCT